MKKILSLIVCLVLVVGIGVGAFFILKPKNNQASAVMTLQTNPEIQLVLDNNNKVMSVNALNEDGEGLMLTVNFIGLSAEEAAKIFAEQASKFVSNKEINLNSNDRFLYELNGKLNVNITIACEDATNEKYTNLKENVKNSVNNYFKEAKMMAGAVINLTEDVKSEIEKLGYDVEDYANKTYAEIMEDIEAKSEELKNIALDKRDEIFDKIEEINSEHFELFDLRDEYNALKAEIENAKEELEALKEQLKTASQIDKIKIESQILIKESFLETQVPLFEGILSTMKELDANYIRNYINSMSNFVKSVRENCKTMLETKKSELQNIMGIGKEIVQSFIDEMTQKGEGVVDSIEQYQNSLNA